MNAMEKPCEIHGKLKKNKTKGKMEKKIRMAMEKLREPCQFFFFLKYVNIS